MSDARPFWKKHVIGWRASGETAKRYSEQHGLSMNSLGWWASRWAKVELARSPSRPIVVRKGDVRIAVEPGFDAETLAAIFAVLDRRPA